MNMELENGSIWYDTNGNAIHAHGGCIIYTNEFYYWYGENRTDNNYISCYKSKDLMNWEFRNNIITTKSNIENIRVRTELSLINKIGKKINLERPKVIYNEKTQKYVLWAHYENGLDYNDAAVAIATCNIPDGDFTYHGSFNPYGYMSRDCTLFKDDNGIAYFISAARHNADLHVYRLTDDYMNTECLVNKLWQGEYREAPAILKKDGVYYMISSFCTGWEPNQAKYGISKDINDSWGMLKNIGDDKTYNTQPAFILPIKVNEKNIYIYISDRWDGNNYENSRYVFLPIIFKENNEIELKYHERFSIDLTKGYFNINNNS